MMLRSWIILQAILYLGFSAGVTTSAHYCGGHQVAYALFSTENDRCGDWERERDEPHGCCEDEVTWFAIEDEHARSQVALPDFSALPDWLPMQPELVWPSLPPLAFSFSPPAIAPATESPPGNSVPLFLFFCSLRIDGSDLG